MEDNYISDLIDEVIKGSEQYISFNVIENELPIPEEYQFTYLPGGVEEYF